MAVDRTNAEYWEGYYAENTEVFDSVCTIDEFLAFAKRLRLFAQGKVLDLGCGTSNFLPRLHAAGLRNLTGIDWSMIAVSLMQTRCERMGINVWVMDAKTMHFTNEHTFDYVLAKDFFGDYLLHKLEDVYLILSEIHRNIKENGTLVIVEKGDKNKLVGLFSLTNLGYKNVECAAIPGFAGCWCITAQPESGFRSTPAERAALARANALAYGGEQKEEPLIIPVSVAPVVQPRANRQASRHEERKMEMSRVEIVAACTAIGYENFDIHAAILQLEAAQGAVGDLNAVIDEINKMIEAKNKIIGGGSLPLQRQKSEMSSLQDQIEELKKKKEDRYTCKICYENEIDTCLMNCGHLCVCNECAGDLSECPLCRKPIQKVVRTYRS
eukprot:TRINITY_DN3877_c0_g1_i6.p1 TRINITY_DN3877_c0_g1~~TRINITY_DN3877_c0_g1_i6.p1  ORF type:complete len:383 (+),score=52.67 TRINITY_DN3877_c0_g1_i6:100-1248(+)